VEKPTQKATTIMLAHSIEEYRQLCRVIGHIPKRSRSKMKRALKRWTLKQLDPENKKRSEALRAYRKQWERPASAERNQRKINATFAK
jgi:inorganic triphosphatase YgiF